VDQVRERGAWPAGQTLSIAGSAMLVLVLLFCGALPAAQSPFDRAVQDLASPSASTRLRAAQLLKEAASPEAALPLARTVTDPQDEVQLEAIAGEINIFLAEKIVPRRRVGGLVEVRRAINAEAAFSAGPLALGELPVPSEVLAALRATARDDNPVVSLESLYAFGFLAVQPGGAARRELLRFSGLDLAAMIGRQDPAIRLAAVRVIGRLFAPRPDDAGVDPDLVLSVGDAVISAANDRERTVRVAAIDALGAMRYERSLQGLTSIFQYYRDGEIAEAALEAVGRIAHPSSAALLASQLASLSAAIRVAAVEGLARLGDPSRAAAIDALGRSERTEAVQLAVAYADVALAGAGLERLTEALGKERLHDQALQYLVELERPRRPMFSRALQDPDPAVRRSLLDALDLALDPGAIPLVEPHVRDGNPQVAASARRALARLRSVTAEGPDSGADGIQRK
jgi:HEAT repeat protein